MKMIALSLALLFLAQSAQAEKRFIGGFNERGERIYVDVDAAPAKVYKVNSGHLPNPDFKIYEATRRRLGVNSQSLIDNRAQMSGAALSAANERFSETLKYIRTSQMGMVKKIKAIAPLYGADPAAVLGSIAGEITFNNPLESAFQNIAAAYLPTSMNFPGATKAASVLKHKAFEACQIERSDYWSWVCANRVWTTSINFSNSGIPVDPTQSVPFPKGYSVHLREILTPNTGVSYGPAQMSLVVALMSSADVSRATHGRIPHLKMHQMPQVIKMVLDTTATVHIVSAVIARVNQVYGRFAFLDLSHNLGVQVSLFNLGDEMSRAIKLFKTNKELISAGKTPVLPRENYLGWFMNEHEAEIRALLK